MGSKKFSINNASPHSEYLDQFSTNKELLGGHKKKLNLNGLSGENALTPRDPNEFTKGS